MSQPRLSRSANRNPLKTRTQGARSKTRRAMFLERLEDRSMLAAFTPGNIVIMRAGSGNLTTANGVPAFVDEYTPSGQLVQTIIMPTSANGANNAFNLVHNSQAEAFMTLSDDGQYLVALGYATQPVSSSERVIARIDSQGNVDTTTKYSDTSGGARAIASSDGSSYWASGGTTPVKYVTHGQTGAPVDLTGADGLTKRQLFVVDGQLYLAHQTGVARVGTGLPTQAGTAVTALPGTAGTNPAYGIFFADLDPTVPGNDTLYITNDNAAALSKHSLVGGAWVLNGTIGVDADNYKSIAGTVSNGVVTLYATRDLVQSPPNRSTVVTLTDSSGYNQPLTGTPTVILTTDTGTFAHGIALVPNAIPTITDIADTSTNANTPTAAIPFNIGDLNTADPATLTVTGSSSNQALVPNANIVFGGSGANRTVTITPAANQIGTSTITVTVSDGNGQTITDTFVLTVVNAPPTISAIADQIINEDGSTGALAFTISDDTTLPENFTIMAGAANFTLFPAANITLGGSGANRTITLVPAANLSGTTTVSITVTDGHGDTATETFDITVNPVDDTPTTSLIADQNVVFGTTSVGPLNFTVGDVDTPLANLTVTAASDNQTILTDANIVLGGSGADRTVTLTLQPNQVGTANVTITISDGNTQVTEVFAVTVAANTAPTFTSTINPVTTDEDTATAAIPFTIGDAESDPTTLTVTAASSNQTLIPDANITVAGSGANRTVQITPAGNLSGTAIITLTLSDGDQTTTTTFQVTVNAVNDAPTVSVIADQTIDEDTSVSNLAFTIGDVETDPATLTVTAASNNQALIPDGSITLGGAGANRTISFTPASNATGTATITVSVSDGTDTTTETFVVTVGDVNDPPTISDIGDQTTNEDTALSSIPFTVGDLEDDPATLTVTAASSDTTLFPAGSITIGGSGASRSISLAPAANLSGSATITVTVTDSNGDTATDTFTVTVNAVDDPPTISDVADQTTDEEVAITNIPVTLGDIDGDVNALTLTAVSSDTTLFPAGSIVVGGSGANRTITLTPAVNQTGTATITLTVDDGNGNTATDTFLVTVNGLNDDPTISDIGNQTTPEDITLSNVPFTLTDVDSDLNLGQLTAISSNPALFPAGSIIFGGSGASRTISFVPAPNQSGTATITVTYNDGNGGTASDSFDVTVTAVNDLPTISDVADQTTNLNQAVGPITVTIDDVETPAANLSLTASSSNTTLIPNANIVISGSGATRTVTITPAAGQSGTATITLTVGDGDDGTATDTFVVTVNANLPPTISNVADQTTSEDTALTNIAVTVGDSETAAGSLTVTASSSDATLFPAGSIVVSGTGASRTLTLTPASNQFGTATITLTVTDAGGLTATDTFVVTVTPVNDAPTISDVTDRTTTEDGALPIVMVTIGDVETPAANLTFTATSSNTTLFPAGSIVVNGSGPNRTVMLSAAPNQSGTATITLTVTDAGGLTATDTFVVTVTPVEDLPTISNVADQLTNEDTPLTSVAVTIGDAETAATALTLTATSSNTTLFPAGSIVLAGTGANRTLTLTPAANQSGTATITLTVTDGAGNTATDTFVVTVAAVNDAPVAQNGSLTVSSTGPTSGTLTATDIDSATLIYAIAVQPTKGTVTITNPSTGAYTYTPNAGATGTDTFQFTANDGTLTSAPATVTVTIASVSQSGSVVKVGNDLVVTGTPRADLVSVLNLAGGVRVFLNGQLYGPFQVSGRLVINTGEANDVISVALWRGPTLINAGAGNDAIITGDGADTIIAGAGDDSIVAGGGANIIWGDAEGAVTTSPGAGRDVIITLSGADQIFAGGGDDIINSGSGDDYIHAGDGLDTILSGSGNDIVRGGVGNDNVWAGQGDDIVVGNEGNDSLNGDSGRDLVIAGAGADTVTDVDFDSDILIDGRVTFEVYSGPISSTNLRSTNDTALQAILNEWVRGAGSLAQRAQRIRVGGGLNGTSTLAVGTTVTGDDTRDSLSSTVLSADWLFGELDLDRITRQSNDLFNGT